MDDNKSSPRKIEYVPPSRGVIQQYAQDVCDQLAVKKNDPRFIDREVVNGFADFLAILLKLEAKRLNKEQDEKTTDLV